MEGKVLGWNASDGEGMIRCVQGNRFKFTQSDWKGSREPVANMRVDFEPEENIAKDVYVLSAGLDDSIEIVKKSVSKATSNLSKNPTLKKITEHGIFNFASSVFMLFVFFFGFVDYAFEGSRASVGLSPASGITGVVFVLATLGFLFSSLFGMRPKITRILGITVIGVLALNVLIALLYVFDIFQIEDIEDVFYYLAHRYSVIGIIALVLSVLLSIVATIIPKQVNPNFGTEEELALTKSSETLNPELLNDPERKYVHISYGLMALYVFTGGLAGIAALILAYLRKGKVEGELYRDHYRFIIRTLWFTLLWTIIAILTVVILVGIVIAIVAGIWFVYRIIKGWLRLSGNKLMYQAK